MVKTQKGRKDRITGMNPSLVNHRESHLERNIRKMQNLSSPDKKIRAFYGTDIRANNTVHGEISSKNKVIQVRNIINSILAWISYQADCFHSKRKWLQSEAERIYDTNSSTWERNKHKPFGLLYDHKNNHLYLQFFEGEVSEEKILSENGCIKMSSFGTVVFFIDCGDRETAAELIKCIYHECGCEVGKKEACPLFGFSLLSKELEKVPNIKVD